MSRVKLILVFTFSFFFLAVLLIYFFMFQGVSQRIEDDIKQKDKVVLLFSADWCGACKQLKPQLHEALQDAKGLTFHEIGSNLNPLRKKALFQKYKVYALPTLVLYKQGKETQRMMGLQTKEELDKAFSSLD